MRVGFGYDAHRLAYGRTLVIAGVTIPYERGLEGFSDADVAVHAVIDALLGAVGMGDCGTHFPAGDERFAGAKSTELLRRTAAMLAGAGFRVGNIDCTVVAEQPVLQPHVAAMRTVLAEVLGIGVDRISVKAKRTEGLGFTGDGSGIEAFATAIVEETR